jgi:3-hydroxybutyryl-CoA dehydrogenase
VIEAVPEDRALKVESLRRIEASWPGIRGDRHVVDLDRRLAATLAHPERFLGLHFFNPVPASALVEIVTGAATTRRSSTTPALGRALGKTAVVVAIRRASRRADSASLGLEAIRMLEEGVATAADIDAAMELGYRHPTGPLRTTDIVGLDVRLGIAEELEAAFGPRFAPPTCCAPRRRGHLGRKTGRGFYEWSDS